MYARTPRLILVPLTREVLAGRLAQAPFTATLTTPDGPLTVTYPPAWPGDLLPLLPARLAAFDPERERWSATLVERATAAAVGQMGARGGGTLDEAGDVEIGYGLNPAAWGRGYATEAVGVLVTALLARPGVRRVTARTALINPASARVLEKLGFGRVGTDWDRDDGDLTVWARAK
ncbi:GNAT family N-acetyltransferase [Deinococcus sp. MIMF12]|uniref:GNAT family N-acetyltransferase n=1 Tax=Deinococcus rhizophilus TaxID=3049544 RepID=A0ABT7JIZ8_9DEIO|nr:GNAT family N-acetyltransferase [Deinococcus rhizophilus]MDL2345029.1 GNAT family N-acetyltransferase [Deinococcus rhizophilus]